jgi:hypothetical protein
LAISVERLEGHMKKLYQLREVWFCNRKFYITSSYILLDFFDNHAGDTVNIY